MAKATAFIAAIFLGVFVGVHEGAVCMERLKLFRQHEMLQSPEIYLVCNDGTSKETDILHLTCNYYSFESELCLDIDLEEPVKCQFVTSDGPFDEDKASFTIDDTTFAIGDTATETDEESYYVMLRMTDQVDSEGDAQDTKVPMEDTETTEDMGYDTVEPPMASQTAESVDDLE